MKFNPATFVISFLLPCALPAVAQELTLTPSYELHDPESLRKYLKTGEIAVKESVIKAVTEKLDEVQSRRWKAEAELEALKKIVKKLKVRSCT
jgi:hypothetical protein